MSDGKGQKIIWSDGAGQWWMTDLTCDHWETDLSVCGRCRERLVTEELLLEHLSVIALTLGNQALETTSEDISARSKMEASFTDFGIGKTAYAVLCELREAFGVEVVLAALLGRGE